MFISFLSTLTFAPTLFSESNPFPSFFETLGKIRNFTLASTKPSQESFRDLSNSTWCSPENHCKNKKNPVLSLFYLRNNTRNLGHKGMGCATFGFSNEQIHCDLLGPLSGIDNYVLPVGVDSWFLRKTPLSNKNIGAIQSFYSNFSPIWLCIVLHKQSKYWNIFKFPISVKDWGMILILI